MEKITNIEPAFDKRDPDQKKNYGIHGCNLRMVLKGELGAVQFLLYTGWQLPHVTEEFRKDMKPQNYYLYEPMAADLGYHSPKPMYEDQSPMSKNCEFIGVPCYYDGSSLNAQEVYSILLEKGSEGVWKKLEEYYISVFEELK